MLTVKDGAAQDDAPKPKTWRSLDYLPAVVISIPAALTLLNFGGAHGMGYGYSELFLNYTHGFSRRALYGSLFQWMPFLSTRFMWSVSQAQIGITIGLVYLVFARQFAQSRNHALLFAFLFGGAGALPHLGFIASFLDVPLFSILIINMFFLKNGATRLGLAWTTVLTIVALMIHEAYAFMYYPAVLVILMLNGAIRRSNLVYFSAHLLVVAACFIGLVLFGNSSGDFASQFASASARTDFPLARDAFIVMHANFRSQVAMVLAHYTPVVVVSVGLTLLTSLPYLAALFRLLDASLAGEAGMSAAGGRPRVATASLALLLAPLALIIVGADVMRWISAMCAGASVVVAYQFCFSPAHATVRARLDRMIGQDWFYAALVVTFLIGPYGQIAGNRLVEKVGELLGRTP